MRYIILSFLFTLSLFALNVDIKSLNVDNGRSTILELKKENGIKYQKVIFGKKAFKIYKHPTKKDKFYVLIPVSYYAKSGKKKLKLIYTEKQKQKTKTLFLNVKNGNYKKEQIKVSSSKVNPKGKKVKKRIAKEYAQAMKTYRHITNKSYISSNFILPIDSFITSDFGKARVYNSTLKGYHGGTDFRAKVPTPIKASNDGVVVLVKNRFYSGGTVVIDHGHGIYTCYFHMSKFDVKEGEMIKKGEIIGLSGATGRITGPHLHFGVRVNGVQVDPLQFIKLLNTKILKKG
ncbi:MAG: M23 family metallopeptidase [Epsilonproteobacteria bacterium]|nr:M23 family metallopeptidase [Campylobacterota bacterium]